MSISPRSLNQFTPPEGCVAKDALRDQGTLRRADFSSALRYLFGTAKRADTEHVPETSLLESIEKNFDLLPGMGKLAWDCATCEARGGDRCNVTEQQEIEG